MDISKYLYSELLDYNNALLDVINNSSYADEIKNDPKVKKAYENFCNKSDKYFTKKMAKLREGK